MTRAIDNGRDCAQPVSYLPPYRARAATRLVQVLPVETAGGADRIMGIMPAGISEDNGVTDVVPHCRTQEHDEALNVDRANKSPSQRGTPACRRRDLNPHARRHRILNPACLPIPPLRLAGARSVTAARRYPPRQSRRGCAWGQSSPHPRTAPPINFGGLFVNCWHRG